MSQFTNSSPWTLNLSFNCLLLASCVLKNGVMNRKWKDFPDVQASPIRHINLIMRYGPWCQNMVFRGKNMFETLLFKCNMYTWKWINIMHNSSDDHYIYYRGQESLRRNGVAIMVNKRVGKAVLGCSLKNDTMISVHLQGKPFNITVIQVYAPNSNAEEAEV